MMTKTNIARIGRKASERVAPPKSKKALRQLTAGRIVDPNIYPSWEMKCSVCGIMIFGDMAYNIQDVHKSCLVNDGFSVEVDFTNLEISKDAPKAADANVRRTSRQSALMSNVNHPQHYNEHPSGIECIDIAEGFNFNVGNAIKYLWRAGLKSDGIEDLEKALWYCQRELERVKNDTRAAKTNQELRKDV